MSHPLMLAAFLGGASKKKTKKGKPSSGSSGPSDQKLNHSLDMIEAFSKLKVEPPITTLHKSPS